MAEFERSIFANQDGKPLRVEKLVISKYISVGVALKENTS